MQVPSLTPLLLSSHGIFLWLHLTDEDDAAQEGCHCPRSHNQGLCAGQGVPRTLDLARVGCTVPTAAPCCPQMPAHLTVWL